MVTFLKRETDVVSQAETAAPRDSAPTVGSIDARGPCPLSVLGFFPPLAHQRIRIRAVITFVAQCDHMENQSGLSPLLVPCGPSSPPRSASCQAYWAVCGCPCMGTSSCRHVPLWEERVDTPLARDSMSLKKRVFLKHERISLITIPHAPEEISVCPFLVSFQSLRS